MTASLVGSSTFAFADGNAGHSCALGSAPSVGQWDILCVNSDTVVSTPSGFTKLAERVSAQGAYIFGRKAVGGESSTVTVTTSGDFNCTVSWSRWSGVNAFDVTANAGVDALDGSVTPDATTAALASTSELVILFGAIHAIFSANQSAPTVTSGYTVATSVKQGSTGSGCFGVVAYRTDAGTAAVTAGVTGWTGDGARDRYTLIATFTPSSTGNDGSGTATNPAVTTSGAGSVEMDGSGSASNPGPTASGSSAPGSMDGSGTAAAPGPTASGSGTGPVAGFATDRQALVDVLATIPGVNAMRYPSGIPAPGQAWPLLGAIDLGRYGEATWHAVFVAGGDGPSAERWLDDNLQVILTALRPFMYVDTVTPVDLGNNVAGVMFAGRKEIG